MYEPLHVLYPNQTMCRRLRSKGMFIEVDQTDPTVEGGEDGMVWCARTQDCLGPDGSTVDVHNCKPGRGCFETI